MQYQECHGNLTIFVELIIKQTIFIFNLKNYEKMFNVKIVWVYYHAY
jgi:hypothetical protein